MNWLIWEQQFTTFLDEQTTTADTAHDRTHILRVVTMAKKLALAEAAQLAIVIPAAWLHDCVIVPKDSPDRHLASQWAAATAVSFLTRAGYPSEHLPAIHHAIAAHSFTAAITPQTLEAKIVQDADRLDALGAIGIARCFITGAHLGLPFYHSQEPFPGTRPADDRRYSLDHFYVKLLRLAQDMQTPAGHAEAHRRTQFMHHYLAQLRRELDE